MITVSIVLFFFLYSDEKVEKLAEMEIMLDSVYVIEQVQYQDHLGSSFDRSSMLEQITVLTFASHAQIKEGRDSLLVAEILRLQDEFAVDNSYSKENLTQVAVIFTDLLPGQGDSLRSWAFDNGMIPTRVRLLLGEPQQNAELIENLQFSANASSDKPVWYLIDVFAVARADSGMINYDNWNKFNTDFARLDHQYKKGR